jgi:hypothetical protein
MSDFRLGDVIDDFCVKCKRLTNHAIVSIVDGQAAKVRCRTCYHDHDYRHEQPPPSKKDLKKQELFAQVLAGVATEATVATVEEAPAEKKKTRARKATR